MAASQHHFSKCFFEEEDNVGPWGVFTSLDVKYKKTQVWITVVPQSCGENAWLQCWNEKFVARSGAVSISKLEWWDWWRFFYPFPPISHRMVTGGCKSIRLVCVAASSASIRLMLSCEPEASRQEVWTFLSHQKSLYLSRGICDGFSLAWCTQLHNIFLIEWLCETDRLQSSFHIYSGCVRDDGAKVMSDEWNDK